jgi:hypothetical protein
VRETRVDYTRNNENPLAAVHFFTDHTSQTKCVGPATLYADTHRSGQWQPMVHQAPSCAALASRPLLPYAHGQLWTACCGEMSLALPGGSMKLCRQAPLQCRSNMVPACQACVTTTPACRVGVFCTVPGKGNPSHRHRVHQCRRRLACLHGRHALAATAHLLLGHAGTRWTPAASARSAQSGRHTRSAPVPAPAPGSGVRSTVVCDAPVCDSGTFAKSRSMTRTMCRARYPLCPALCRNQSL